MYIAGVVDRIFVFLPLALHVYIHLVICLHIIQQDVYGCVHVSLSSLSLSLSVCLSSFSS